MQNSYSIILNSSKMHSKQIRPDRFVLDCYGPFSFLFSFSFSLSFLLSFFPFFFLGGGCFWDRASPYSSDCPGIHQAGFKLRFCLPSVGLKTCTLHLSAMMYFQYEAHLKITRVTDKQEVPPLASWVGTCCLKTLQVLCRYTCDWAHDHKKWEVSSSKLFIR